MRYWMGVCYRDTESLTFSYQRDTAMRPIDGSTNLCFEVLAFASLDQHNLLRIRCFVCLTSGRILFAL